jgi:hypothetical protein
VESATKAGSYLFTDPKGNRTGIVLSAWGALCGVP